MMSLCTQHRRKKRPGLTGDGGEDVQEAEQARVVRQTLAGHLLAEKPAGRKEHING